MIFNTHELNPPLSRHIESIFHFKGFVPDHSIERVVPTGHIFLLFELDGFTRHTYDNDTLEVNADFRHVWISGMHKKYISISAHENSEMFVVQFKATGAFPFIHQPIEQFNDLVLPADQVFGGDILNLRDLILNASTSADKFALVESWLLNRFEEKKTPPVYLTKLVELLQKESMSQHQEIIRNHPKSHKHLIDQFKKFMGMTPKYYQRILRFNDVLSQIHQQQQINWPDVALLCGYSDQSHFIKEFHHFSGFNPSEYFSKEYQHDEPNFFALDRNSETG
ncbi:MAG: helix-turn-helix domain-containing protein [Marinicella sp.]